jgi:plasmid maintenance system antidote protein VapI
MNVTEFKNYLSEKNISVKEFAKITKVKEKKLSRVLDNQAFFSDDEATRVSSFLGVSKNELYHGVIERKGELPEVAEQNNINHF